MSNLIKIKLILIIVIILLFTTLHYIVNVKDDATKGLSKDGIYFTDVSGNTYGYVDSADVYSPEHVSNPENIKEEGDCKITDGYLFLNGNWVECDHTLKTFLNSNYKYINLDNECLTSQIVTLNNDAGDVIDVYIRDAGSEFDKATLSKVVINNAGSTVVEGFCVGDPITKASKVLGKCYLDSVYSNECKSKTWVNSDSTVVFTCYYNSSDNFITSMSVEYINR